MLGQILRHYQNTGLVRPGLLNEPRRRYACEVGHGLVLLGTATGCNGHVCILKVGYLAKQERCQCADDGERPILDR